MSQKQIVVVDDEPSIVQLLTTFLTVKGYAVYGASSGEEALEFVRGFKPDALLLDLMLPDIDGFEVLDQVRAQPEFASLPVLIISARGDQEAKNRAYQAGANRYLSKPVPFADLLTALEELIG